MQSTKKKQGSKRSAGDAESIRKMFVESWLTEGKRPASVYKFCVDRGMSEEEFYTHFGSFEGLERQLWQGFADETIALLKTDTDYAGFTAREKLLAFYFTLLEVLKRNRSFVLLQGSESRHLELSPYYLADFKKTFEKFTDELISQARNNGEVAIRPYLDKVYPQAFWIHFEFIFNFWKHDHSAGFEQTDAAVEKSVNLAFDLISKGAFDRAIDFAKFLYQTRA